MGTSFWNISRILVCTALLGIASLPQVALANLLGGGAPQPVLTGQQGGQVVQNGKVPTAWLDESNLMGFEVLNTTRDESLTMILHTTWGCHFELLITPDEPVEVIGGEGGRCDFEAYIASTVVWVDPGLISNVWTDSAWWNVFESLTHGPGGGGDPSDPPLLPDPRDLVEVEEASECGKAVAMSVFTGIGCGASAGVALGLTGASMGVFAGSFALTVAACGAFAVTAIDAQDKCDDTRDSVFHLDLEMLMLYDEFVVEGALQSCVDPQELIDTYFMVEDWVANYGPQTPVDTMVDQYVDMYSSVPSCPAN